MAKKRTLEIGRQVEVIRGTEPPTVDGHPMTIGELLVRVIPTLPSSPDTTRQWRLGLEMDKAIGEGNAAFEMSDLDYEMLKNAATRPSQHPVWGQNWVKANLEMAFGE